MNITNTYNDNMLPCVIFGEFNYEFIFVDTKNNVCCKSEDATVEWLKKNNISVREFANNCQAEFYDANDNGVKHGIFAYFHKDDEAIYNYSNQIDVAAAYEEIVNF